MQAPVAIQRVRTIRVGWPALAIIAAGWGWTLLQLQSGGRFSGRPPVAISFAALWLILVLLLMAAWDLVVAVDRDPADPSLGFGPQRFPTWLQHWLVPAAFLLGMLLGHWYWR